MDEWVDFKQGGQTSCSEFTEASEVVTHCHCVCSGATNKNAGSLAVDEQEKEVDSKAAAILLSHKVSQVRDAENWCYFLPLFLYY